MVWNKVWMVAGLGLATLLPAQGEQPAAPKKERTVAEWIEALGSGSYEDRVAAERALRRAGKDAVPALQQAAAAGGRTGADTDPDGEVQWRARRLLRQIENGAVEEPRAPERQQDPTPRRGGRALPGVGDQFEDLFRRMERDFGIDIPRRRLFGDDFFRDLDVQFEDLQRGLQRRSQGMSMQVTPDGVRVEVNEENEAGEVVSKVYEAPDMATFRQNYPDVLKNHGIGGWVFEWRTGPVVIPPMVEDRDVELPRGFEWPMVGRSRATAPAEASREYLGVTVHPEVPAGVREYLELGAGVGLMVATVQDDSLAAKLGLQRGDIITAIAGRKIGSPDDVHAALSAIDPGAEVGVDFVRKGSAKSAAVAKPGEPKSDASTGPAPRIERRRGGR